MLSDERVDVVPTWARDDERDDDKSVRNDHRAIDQRLRAIVREEAA